MKNIIQIYYIIIEQFKCILKENKLDNDTIFAIGIHMLEHIFKFCNLYNMPQLDTCKKAIYYYIEFILQLKLNDDSKLSKLKKNSVCIFIYNKLFTLQPKIKYKKNLEITNILLQILNYHYIYRRDIKYLISPLSKLNCNKLKVYNKCLLHLSYYNSNTILFIKQHINFIKLIKQANSEQLIIIKNNLFRLNNTIINIKLQHFIYKH